jgi:hypothetical protein
MKKRIKRFDVGGDVRARALQYAALADKPEEQAEFQRQIHEAQQREAELLDLMRNAERRNVAKRTDMGSQNDFTPSVTPRTGRVSTRDATDYGAESEAYGQAMTAPSRGGATRGGIASARIVADEPVDIIGQVPLADRPTMMAEPPPYPRRGEMKATESRARPEVSEASVPTLDRQPMTERSVSDRFRESVLSGGATDIRNIAGALAGPAAGRAASAAARGASEVSGSAGAQRVMDAAARRAAQTRAEKAAESAPLREILRGAQQTETARRAAETRERAIRKAQETMGRGTARTRARTAERRQDVLDEMRMGGEGGGFKKGGKVSASSRADGIAKRGKTRGRMY